MPLTQNKRPISRAARYAAAASLSTSRRNSASGIANSVKPQFKQTRSFGKTHTMGLSSPSSPGNESRFPR